MKMQKRKKKFCLVICMLILLLLTGCGKKIDKNEATEILNASFSEVFVVDEKDKNVLSKTLKEGIEFKVNKVKKTDDGFTVNCEISNYDVNKAYEKLASSENKMDIETFSKKMSETLVNGERLSLNTDIKIIKNDNNEYEAQFTEEQYDCATGGLLTFYNSLMEE